MRNTQVTALTCDSFRRSFRSSSCSPGSSCVLLRSSSLQRYSCICERAVCTWTGDAWHCTLHVFPLRPPTLWLADGWRNMHVTLQHARHAHLLSTTGASFGHCLLKAMSLRQSSWFRCRNTPMSLSATSVGLCCSVRLMGGLSFADSAGAPAVCGAARAAVAPALEKLVGAHARRHASSSNTHRGQSSAHLSIERFWRFSVADLKCADCQSGMLAVRCTVATPMRLVSAHVTGTCRPTRRA